MNKPHCDFHKQHQRSCSECAFALRIETDLIKAGLTALGAVSTHIKTLQNNIKKEHEGEEQLIASTIYGLDLALEVTANLVTLKKHMLKRVKNRQ